MTSFGRDYDDARALFLGALEAHGIRSDAFVLPLLGPAGSELACDVAWLGDPAAKNVLVMISGTHGVEGFFGAAVQTEWVKRGEHLRLPPDTAALLIHAINPYGFAWLRRTNEDNVDLNRNWIDFDQPLPANDRYDEIRDDLCPADWSAESQAATAERLAAWRAEHGWDPYLKAVTGGQWTHRQGLFFGGAEETWSRKVLTGILTGRLADATHVKVLDFHTGLGPHGYAEPIIHRRTDDPGFERTRRWIGAAATSLYGGSVSAEVHGDGMTAIQSILPHATVDGVSLECGIAPINRVEIGLRADAWLHAHGNPTSPEAAPIKRLIRDAFHSDSPVWQGMALGQGLAAARHAAAGFAA